MSSCSPPSRPGCGSWPGLQARHAEAPQACPPGWLKTPRSLLPSREPAPACWCPACGLHWPAQPLQSGSESNCPSLGHAQPDKRPLQDVLAIMLNAATVQQELIAHTSVWIDLRSLGSVREKSQMGGMTDLQDLRACVQVCAGVSHVANDQLPAVEGSQGGSASRDLHPRTPSARARLPQPAALSMESASAADACGPAMRNLSSS